MRKSIHFLMIGIYVVFFLSSTVYAKSVLTGEQIKGMTVEEVAQAYSIDVSTFIRALSSQSGVRGITEQTQFSLLHDNYGLTSNTVKAVAEAIGQGESGIVPVKKTIAQGKGYSFPLIFAFLCTGYVASLVLVKKGVLSLVMQRRAWNSLLGIFFTVTATFGMILVLRISYGWNIELPINILYWHVQAGIAFSVIALFHILWHGAYFRAFFPKKK